MTLTHFDALFVPLVVQSLFYGLYIASLVHCLRWLIYKDEGWQLRDKINWPILAATALIFLLSTVNLGLTLEVPSLFFIASPRWIQVLLMDTSEVTLLLIADVVLIYRCWAAYGKSWRVIFVPLAFWSCGLASAIATSYYGTIGYRSPPNAKVNDTTVKSSTALIFLYSCNIANTTYTSSAIIYRILRVSSASNNKTSLRSLHKTARIIAESGILYSTMTLFSLVGTTISLGSSSSIILFVSIMSDVMNLSLAGITFNLVIIRVYQSRLESMDGSADSLDVGAPKTLSGLRFDAAQATTLSQGQAEPADEISETQRTRN